MGRTRTSTLLTALATVAVALAVVVAMRPLLLGAGVGPAAAASRPPLPEQLSAQPLGAPAAPPEGSGGYALLDTQDGRAVTWDPCRPVHYVVDTRTAPPGGEYLLADALARLQTVTGLVFVADGATDEVPQDRRPAYQPERYGDRWAPVLVSWSDPASHPDLAGDVAAYAGPQPVDGDGPGTRRYVTGVLVLDGPQLAEMAAGPAGLARARAVVLHELAHLLGLGHVEDHRQLMYPSTTPLVVDFADGDLRGLAEVSAGPCFRDF